MNCPNCGLPMSLVVDADIAPTWYCDGPNSETTSKGCYTEAFIGDEEPQERLI